MERDMYRKRKQYGWIDEREEKRQDIGDAGRRGEDGDNDNDTLKSVKIHPLLRVERGEEMVNPIKKADWRTNNNNKLNPYIDPELIKFDKGRNLLIKNEFNFKRGGSKFSEYGKNYRDKVRHDRENEDKVRNLKEKGLLPDISKGEELFKEVVNDNIPPYIEWWDESIDKYMKDGKIDEIITQYIQHPVPIEAPWTRLIPKPKPMYLTKEEIRKIRRNRRMIKMKDKQDMIKLGLEKVPETKVKLKNLVNILTNESIKNPSEVEMKVRKDIENRRKRHEEMNKEREVSKEDKDRKRIEKNEEDLNRGIYCNIYFIKKLTNGKHRYKVDINAKEMNLSGVCVINEVDGSSLVIVEGSLKNVEKYNRLMMKRIDWTVNEVRNLEMGNGNSDSLDNDFKNNECSVVWSGEILKRRFYKWTMYDFNNGEEILKFLGKFEMTNYWRQCTV